jgi:hypothetical protein
MAKSSARQRSFQPSSSGRKAPEFLKSLSGKLGNSGPEEGRSKRVRLRSAGLIGVSVVAVSRDDRRRIGVPFASRNLTFVQKWNQSSRASCHALKSGGLGLLQAIG